MRYLVISAAGVAPVALALGSLLFDLQTGGAALTLASLLLAWPALIHPISRDRELRRLLTPILLWESLLVAFHVFWLIPFYGPAALDSFGYHSAAVEVADHIRRGEWSLIPYGLGSEAVVIFTGSLYALFGSSIHAMFLISAAFGLGGTFAFHKAFALWQTAKGARLYATVLLFLPSMGVWRSLFGKDSLVVLGLGIACWGYSVWLARRQALGLLWGFLGLAVVGLIRPHVAVVVAASLLATEGWRRGRHRGAVLLKILVGLGLLVPILATLGYATKEYVSLQQDSLAGLLEVGVANARSNAMGGSAVVNPDIRTLFDLLAFLPQGFVRLFLRPFLWEAHNANAWLAALENLFLLGFLLRSLPALPRTIRNARRQPYFLFALLMAAELTLMFSLLTNLGLISRMKTMIYPFLFAVMVGASTPAPACQAVRRLAWPRRLPSGHRLAGAGTGPSFA